MKTKFNYIVILFFSIFLSACSSSKKKNDDTTVLLNNDKPNIIYILADDLGYGDLSSYGQQKFSTPNIDKLASDGMLFTEHYSGSSVCAPSRSALMTGLTTGHTVVRGNKEVEPEGQYPIPLDTYTLAKAMKKAGYITGAFGKWGLGFPGSEGDPTKQGFDNFYGYNCQRQAHDYYPPHLWSNNDSVVLNKNLKGQKNEYAPYLIQKKTLEFIETNKDQPFFLFIPSVIPHAELAVPSADLENYKGKFLPEKPYKGGYYGAQKTPHAAFVAMVKILDKQVGEIVQKLEDLSISKKTIVVFTSDNGPHEEGGADPDYFDSNGPFRGVKRDLYEGGIRVPMIVKWPNKIKSNSKTNHISAFWDIMPTFSEIVGIEYPNNIDGISFLPTLISNGENQKNHDYLYWEFHEMGGRQAIRMGKWKAIKYNVFKHPNRTIELYDLSTDIGEEHNVAKEHPAIVNKINKILNEARTPSDVFTFSQ